MEIQLGVPSELVVARKSEAGSVAESDNPSQDWQGIVCKGMDQINLASLWTILEGEEIQVDNVVARSAQIRLAAEVSENGPWVFAIPVELRDVLSHLAGEDEVKIQSVAHTWAATEELNDWDYSDVAALLQEVIDIADGAKLDGMDLLLWICL